MFKIAKADKQLNKGFTLLEVLIAVIILAIVCIPVFSALATAARTTGKSKMKMLATNAAENIMEDIQTLSVEDAIKKYSLATMDLTSLNYTPEGKSQDASGNDLAYKIEVTDQNDIFDEELNEALGKSYKATVIIDPSNYTHTNAVNMSEYNAVSRNTSAIYCMEAGLDDAACKFFADLNKEYGADREDALNKSKDDFRSLLKREIRVDIEKKGTYVDTDGEAHDKVAVSLSVTYLLADSDNSPQIVPDNCESYRAISRQIFNNSTSEKDLSAIFIMYDPFYTSAKNNGDIIIVHNHDNIETDLYVIAQNVESNSNWGNYRTAAGGGLNLQIYEGEIEDKVNGGFKQPITLRTNVLDSSIIEKYKDETKSEIGEARQVPAQCFLTLRAVGEDPEGTSDEFNDTVYQRILNRGSVTNHTLFENKKSSKALNVSYIDGETGDASTIDNRIYDVEVTVEKVYDPAADSSSQWPISVTLKGTMLDKWKKD